MPKRTSLPSMFPPHWSAMFGWSTPSCREPRVAVLLRRPRTTIEERQEDHQHGGIAAPSPAGGRLIMRAEGEAQRGGDDQDRQHLEEVAETASRSRTGAPS